MRDSQMKIVKNTLVGYCCWFAVAAASALPAVMGLRARFRWQLVYIRGNRKLKRFRRSLTSQDSYPPTMNDGASGGWLSGLLSLN